MEKFLIMDNPTPHLPSAFYQMAFDFLSEVIKKTDDPHSMAVRIAEKYRELTGARTVLFFQNLQLFGGTDFRYMTANPLRRKSLAGKAHIVKMLHEVSAAREVLILNCDPGPEPDSDTETGDYISIGVPLLNSHGQNVGVVVLLDLPHEPRYLPQILETIKFLTGYISPVFHNALTQEFQENLIAEKTNALEEEIQQRKEILKNTDRQKILLETIINAIPNIICLKDGEGRWIMANDYDIDLFQLSGVDFYGKTSAALADLTPFYRDVLLNGAHTDKRAWELKKISRGEEIIPRPDGSSRIFDVVKIPLFNPDGTRHALVVTGQDITERKQNETILKQAKEEWENTFDAISDIITIMDDKFKIIRANKAAVAFFREKRGGEKTGLSGEREENSIIGMHCHDLFRGSSEVCPECPAFMTAEEMRSHEKTVEHKDLGKIFHVTSCPIFDKNNDVQLLVHVAKDITEHRRLERELLQSHKMEAMGTLAGGIAHDFNNILSAIIGFSELAIMDTPEDSDAVESMEEVLKASRRAADLVKQILTFSRKSDFRIAPLLPQVIVKEALKMLRASLPTTIEIQENINDACGKIMADPTSIHQIVVNLCTNALHAMENEKGTLTVSLEPEVIDSRDIKRDEFALPGGYLVMKISDTGHGIDPSIVDRIFEPYFTTKAVNKGTGLGLAVVHGIVKECNGFIRVKSKPGQGTTFYVYFPVLPEETPLGFEDELPEMVPKGGQRILLVDDEPMIIKLNKTILERLGYEVSSTTRSFDALERISREPHFFDLVITDQTMPGLTGVELSQNILKIRPDLPIILCTGYSAILSEADALSVGIQKYLRKPVSRKLLSTAVKEVLDKG